MYHSYHSCTYEPFRADVTARGIYHFSFISFSFRSLSPSWFSCTLHGLGVCSCPVCRAYQVGGGGRAHPAVGVSASGLTATPARLALSSTAPSTPTGQRAVVRNSNNNALGRKASFRGVAAEGCGQNSELAARGGLVGVGPSAAAAALTGSLFASICRLEVKECA